MKKLLLFLSFLLMSIGMWGATETITLSNFGWSNASVQSSISSAVATISLAKNSAGTAPTYYTSDGLRIYGVKNGATTGGTISFTPKTGITISKIEFTHTSSNSGVLAIKSGTGSYTNKTWTGTLTAGNTVILVSKNNTNSNPQVRITQIVITYTSTAPSLYTVTYNANGGAVSPSSWTQTSSGQSTILPTPSRDGYTFNGWYTASSGGSKIGNAGASYTPTVDITLHAQWTENIIPPAPVDDETFELLTDIENLKSGDEIVILNTGGTYALSTTQNSNNRGSSTDFTLSLNTVTITGNTVQVINIGGSAGEWTFNVGTGYLYAASSSNNYLRTQTSNNANGEWSITLNASNEATITAQGSNTRNILEFNAQNSIFACYGSTSQVAVKIYKKIDNCTKTVPVRKGPETNGTFSLDNIEVCADAPGGTVNVTDIIPADGYVFDTIICVTAKEPFTQLGTVNLSEKKVTGITDSCYITVIFKESPNIDIVEWNPDWLKIDIENFTAATATLEDQNTQADIEINYADSLFFSKYFEAASNVKLLGIYNGTNHTIDISSYGIAFANCGNDKLPGSFEITLFSEMVYRDVNNYDNELSFTSEEMQLEPNHEIILISYQKNNAADSAIIKCAKDNSKSGFSSYYRLKTPNIQFNGDDAIALVNPDGNFIDLIGAGTKASGSVVSSVIRTTTTTGTYNGFMDNPGGWYSTDGINIETNDSIYALSTNRCLLIRKNKVKSGLNAVIRNTTDFVTLGGIYGEWRGLQIPGSTEGGTGVGVTNACTGFDDIGSFDYNDYYIDYDTIYEEQSIPGQEDDGYYKIEIPNLDRLSCTNLKITVKDASNNVLEEVVKIPIMIKTNTTTDDDDYFDKKDCDKCDVVVLKDKTLTVAGTTSANRDMKLYEGAELRVPTSTSYTINSLAFRRYNDSISSLKLDGTLLVNKLYFDLYITPDKWHYISLPDTFIVSNVKYVNGKNPNYGTGCLARWYNGEYRALHQGGGWKNVEVGMKFNPGNGFIFGLSDEFKKKEFRFELSADIIAYEKINKTVSDLHAWGITNNELRPNHKGWNLIGNPFMSHFNAEIYDKIRVDSLVKVIENGKWTGQWELSGTSRGRSLRYAVIPSDAPEDRDAGGYKSVVLDDMKLLPFTCFFVQLGGDNDGAQGIEFKASRQTNRIVAKNCQENEEDEELFLRIKIGDKKTGCFISNHFNENYEPGDDLESRYAYYQLINGYKLLYSAINDSIIENGVQIHSNGGKVTLDPKVETEKFELIYILYNNTWYDLLHGDEPEVSGDFVLYGKRKVSEDISTDIGNIKPGQGTYKFLHENNIFINNKGKIYNVFGNSVQ